VAAWETAENDGYNRQNLHIGREKQVAGEATITSSGPLAHCCSGGPWELSRLCAACERAFGVWYVTAFPGSSSRKS